MIEMRGSASFITSPAFGFLIIWFDARKVNVFEHILFPQSDPLCYLVSIRLENIQKFPFRFKLINKFVIAHIVFIIVDAVENKPPDIPATPYL